MSAQERLALALFAEERAFACALLAPTLTTQAAALRLWDVARMARAEAERDLRAIEAVAEAA